MNFSDETVEKCASAINTVFDLAFREQCRVAMRAVLQSLTLADLMQVPEVRELVEAGCLVCASIGCEKAESTAAKRWSKALTPFTEAK